MALTLDALCGGYELKWDKIRSARATPEDKARLARRHLDAKYGKTLDPINDITGVMELSRNRLRVSIEYLIALAGVMQSYNGQRVIDVALTEEQKAALRRIPEEFDVDQQAQIELIEKKAEHDLAATTDWLKMQLLSEPRYGLQQYADAVHFALTSENINGPCFGLMHHRLLLEVILPVLIEVQELCLERGERYLRLPIVAFTHGQPAEPTTLGKEYLNSAAAIDTALRRFLVRDEQAGEKMPFRFTASMRGAVGNLNDHYAAYSEINWRGMLDGVVASFGLDPVDMSDQCEPFSRYHAFANILDEIGSAIIKCAEDFWLHVHDQVYDKKTKGSHKGSSVMAQKKNPWLVEGGAAILEKGLEQLHFTIKRMRGYHNQGDMSRSILSRDIGDDYGKIVLGIRRIIQEMRNYVPNERRIQEHLQANLDIASGALLALFGSLRVQGEAYRDLQTGSAEARKGFAEYRAAVAALCDNYNLPEDQKARALELLKPESNLGAAVQMGNKCIKRCRGTIAGLKELYHLENEPLLRT